MSVYDERDAWLPFEPPGWKRRQRCVPGRCWEVSRRDRFAWRLFCLFANSDHSSVVWKTFRSTRRARETRWTF